MTVKITLIGCGKMGSALLEGWLNAFPSYEFGVIEPSPLNAELAGQVTHSTNAAGLQDFLSASDIIVMAVKPQVMEEICTALKAHIKPKTLILSIAAGQSLDSFAQYFGTEQPVIRAMPNTPAAIGKGMSAAIANPHANNEQKTLAAALLESAGLFEWVEDEALLNAVTAVSGSGPAYIFYLIEMLERAARSAGLSDALSKTLARQTVIGSAALAEDQANIDAATLRENVTSPNGTTAAALEVLMNGEMQALMTKAVAAAKARGEELA